LSIFILVIIEHRHVYFRENRTLFSL